MVEERYSRKTLRISSGVGLSGRFLRLRGADMLGRDMAAKQSSAKLERVN